MSHTSAHLTDNVLPSAPYRQWVLSMPMTLRFWLSKSRKILAKIHSIFISVITKFYEQKIKKIYGTDSPKSGSITSIQRCGSALNNNTHFHSIFIEGAFEQISKDEVVFRRAPRPTDEEVGTILQVITEKIIKLLKKKGFLKERDQENFEELDIQTKIALASAHNCDATGENAGRTTRKVGEGFGRYGERPIMKQELCASLNYFSLHAATFIKEHRKEQLEKLIRYISRPPLSNERIELTPSGDVSYRLKKSRSGGPTHVIFTKEEFIARLAGLVPLPWLNLIRYNGVFAPASPLRKAVIALKSKVEAEPKKEVKRSQ